ncbi:MAG: hypothetical protein NZM43_11355 [Saprospiraceae bacterium]|nr:hypothetical protein [Saprospiraceae bacterium]MDW8484905.1 hypothetical protein [Saprospiraceae bacterium]
MLRFAAVWLWIGSLLISTIGVSVVRIYCYCTGEGAVMFSLALSPEESDEESCAMLGHEEAACCSAQQSLAIVQLPNEGCCGRSAMDSCPAAKGDGWQAGTYPCMSKSVEIHQLKLDVYYPTSLDKLLELPLWADEVPVLRKCFCPALCWRQPLNKAPPKALPALSGRQICIRHEVFRC